VAAMTDSEMIARCSLRTFSEASRSTTRQPRRRGTPSSANNRGAAIRTPDLGYEGYNPSVSEFPTTCPAKGYQ
jgi:hypothetical protein